MCLKVVLLNQSSYYHLSLDGKLGDGVKAVATADQPIAFNAAYSAGADGVVAWDCPGAFPPACAHNASLCRRNATKALITDVVGPIVKRLQDNVAACSAANCSGHGRCKVLPGLQPPSPLRVTQPAEEGGGQQCWCAPGFSGPACTEEVPRA